MSAAQIRDRDVPKAVRRCPYCGESWPILTPHLCEMDRELAHPDNLAALIQEIIQDADASIYCGTFSVDIAGALSVVLSQEIADQLVLRRLLLIGALCRDDVLEPAPQSRTETVGVWRLAHA